jgi:hypothetical protein
MKKMPKLKKMKCYLIYIWIVKHIWETSHILVFFFFNFDLNEVNKCIWTRQPDR